MLPPAFAAAASHGAPTQALKNAVLRTAMSVVTVQNSGLAELGRKDVPREGLVIASEASNPV